MSVSLMCQFSKIAILRHVFRQVLKHRLVLGLSNRTNANQPKLPILGRVLAMALCFCFSSWLLLLPIILKLKNRASGSLATFASGSALEVHLDNPAGPTAFSDAPDYGHSQQWQFGKLPLGAPEGQWFKVAKKSIGFGNLARSNFLRSCIARMSDPTDPTSPHLKPYNINFKHAKY